LNKKIVIKVIISILHFKQINEKKEINSFKENFYSFINKRKKPKAIKTKK
jgi:hypothetical protein